MKKTVMIATVVGLLVPIFWIVVSFLTLSGKASPATDFYWEVVRVTCPPWVIPASSPFASTAALPLLNAALYGGLAFVGYALAKLFRRVLQRL